MLTNNVTFSERVKSVSIKAPPRTQRGWCPTWKHTLALIIDTGGCSLSVRAVEKLNHIGSDAASKPSASSGSETDNVRWAVQCNWSVDYYQPCVCQIKTPLKIHTECSCGAATSFARLSATAAEHTAKCEPFTKRNGTLYL